MKPDFVLWQQYPICGTPMTTKHPLLPLPDYQRIYQVAYSVLETSEIAITHRACIFFAAVGTLILREHYKLPATISAGCMAIMVDEAKESVVVYGRNHNGVVGSDDKAFHAWCQCDGWLIDFMAPIMGVSLREDGVLWDVPRRMLQMRLADSKEQLNEIRHLGELYAFHDHSLTESLIDRQSIQFEDLLNICRTWYRRPPKPLKALMMGDTHAASKRLVARAPTIEGAW
ncbi:MAG: DUF2026 domain-containing protein [Pseudomonadales bacterium]|jgi:hypothetical protein|nr:DUF2026 domain-containing protein [Pseudomonadales bacterium]